MSPTAMLGRRTLVIRRISSTVVILTHQLGVEGEHFAPTQLRPIIITQLIAAATITTSITISITYRLDFAIPEVLLLVGLILLQC